MTDIVKALIATRDDGHDFYPYREQAYLLGHVPTKEDIAEFVENMIEAKYDSIMNDDNASASVKGTAIQIISAFRWNPEYRAKAIAEAVEYIFDPDFSLEDE